MEGGDIRNFIGVWSTAIISGIYCYTISKSTKANSPLLRLLLLLPAAAAFTFLPLTLSSFHLGVVSFFSLTWLANFKLLLLTFNTGPPATRPAASSLSHFLCALLLPIKFTAPDPDRPGPARGVRWAKAAAFWGKVLCFGMLVVPYSYKEELSEAALVALHCGHTYLLLEISLAAAAGFTRAALGLRRNQLAPQFNEPYLSTSLQDFWGRRCNIYTIVMEGEIGNFIGVWSTAIISGVYCYTVSKSTKAISPLRRLLLLLPAAAAFTALPLTLSTFHLGVVTFFSLTWLANFKLLLLSFGTGPLTGPVADSSLPHFLCALLLPIKFTATDPDKPGPARYVVFWAKVLCFGLLVVPYSYKEELSEFALLVLHGGHTYLLLEISLAAAAGFTRAALGLLLNQLAPQFNEPYLSTSLQDFWGRRWNLIASDILKQTVHSRIRSHFTPLIGRQLAMYVGILTTFLVSGIMHEFMYYYITRVNTEWAIMRFFVFYGLCMTIEVMVKTSVSGRWHLHRAISTALTAVVLSIGGVWLFFPSLLKNRVYEKAIVEYFVVAECVKSVFSKLKWECLIKFFNHGNV